MNKRYLVIAAALTMLAMIAAAFAVDCVRLADQARRRVELADQELAKHEQRLATLVEGSPSISSEARQAVAAYKAAAVPEARHDAYDRLVAAVRHTMAADVNPDNVLARKFMDDVAGAINRREMAAPAYDAERLDYLEYLSGVRGAVARWFSPTSDADWKSK
jgi:hypothetical protein